MNTIKNLHLLHSLVSTEILEKLEYGAKLHKRFSNITFKVIEYSNVLMVRTVQEKNSAENYASTDRLVEITKHLFGIIPGVPNKEDFKLQVHPVTFQPSKTDVVTPEWLNKKMLINGVKVKDISLNTGIDKTNISAWINGLRPMSQIVKSMFYYYFEEVSYNNETLINDNNRFFYDDIKNSKKGDVIVASTKRFSYQELFTIVLEHAKRIKCKVEVSESAGGNFEFRFF